MFSNGVIKVITVILLVMQLLHVPEVYAADSGTSDIGIRSTEIIESHMDGLEDCVDYCVIGVCFWLVCKLFDCSVETSPKIAHNRPEFTVSTYKHPGEMTYLDAADLYGDMVKEVGFSAYGLLDDFNVFDGGNETTARNESRNNVETNLRFKEASIIGNASTAVTTSYMCESAVTPFLPYYQSEIDSVAWRYGTDSFNYKSYLIGYKEVGDFPSYTFGPTYPRIGFIVQTDDFKAASVIAARSMSILKEDDSWGHLKYELSNDHVKQKGHEFMDNDEPWQTVYPKVSSSCKSMGHSNNVNYLNSNRSEEQKNAWVYWQRYKCCEDNAGIYLGSVEFPEPVCVTGS